MIVHLYGEKVAHLAVCRDDVFKKSDVTDHVFDCVALVKVVHNDAHSSLIFAQNLDAAVLNFVVINDECFYFH